MTATPTYITGGVVWVKAMRLSKLDPDGFIIPGSNVFVTDTLMKCTITPVNETGDQIAIKNAAGNLGVFAIKGDIPKWATLQIDLVTPDPQLEALLCGGTVFNDTTAALGAPDIPTVATVATGGSLKAGEYIYGTANYTAFGRSTISPQATQVTTGSSSLNVITPDFTTGSLGAIIYGRLAGLLQKIGSVPNIGTQTAGDVPMATVTNIAVTALTDAIPEGTQFQITGDTNTPPVTFVAAETGLVGSTVLSVESVAVTIAITGAAMIPVFTDTGSITPVGLPSGVDLTGGPGLAVGQQAHVLGEVPNPYGVGLELFMERIIEGAQAGDYPFTWFVLPRCANFVVGARDATNAEMASTFTGNAFANPNFGAGPAGDFPFDSSQIFQWTGCGEDVVPVPSVVAQQAGF